MEIFPTWKQSVENLCSKAIQVAEYILCYTSSGGTYHQLENRKHIKTNLKLSLSLVMYRRMTAYVGVET
jgi:hypothetical protein